MYLLCLYTDLLHIRTIDVNKCKFVSLYRSPSQTSEDFEKFTDHLELTLNALAESNSHLVVVLGDFDIKPKNWFKTTTVGAKIEFVTLQYGLRQIIQI